MIRSYILPLAGVGALIFATLHVVKAAQPKPVLDPPVAPARTPFSDTIAGAGIAEPRTENISIGAHVPGVVAEVFVRVGQQVKRGEVLFRIDDRQLRAELSVREAMLASAEAQLAKLEDMPRAEELPPAEAKVREGKATLERHEDVLERSRRLRASRVLPEEELIRAQKEYESAREQLSRAQAEYELLRAGAWGPDKAVARAGVRQARAQVEETRVELDRLGVRASVDGEVLQVNVRPGEFVGTPPGQAFVVLGDIRRLYVRVDIDEHDIPRFRTGAPARASVRGAQHVEFPLQFIRVEPYVIPKKSLTGDNTERVDTRVLQVIYAVDSSDHRLYVGQQLDVFVDLAGEPDDSSTGMLAANQNRNDR